MTRQALICGAVGHNLGDAAIAIASARELTSLLPDWRFVVSTLRPGALMEAPGIRELTIDRRSLRGWYALLQEVRDSDAVMIGGGSMFQDALGIGVLRGMLPYVGQIALLARVIGREYGTLHVGVDPIASERGKLIARSVLARAAHVEVRDDDSARRVVALGLSSDGVFASADPAFLWPASDEMPGNRAGVVVAVPNEGLWTGDMLFRLRTLVSRLASTEPGGVRLLCMDERPTEEAAVYLQLLASVPMALRDRVILLPRTGRVSDAVAALRTARVVVAMRLHAAILAAGHTSVVVWSRGAKSDSLVKSLCLPELPREQAVEYGDAHIIQSLGGPADLEVQRRTSKMREAARQGLRRVAMWLRDQANGK